MGTIPCEIERSVHHIYIQSSLNPYVGEMLYGRSMLAVAVIRERCIFQHWHLNDTTKFEDKFTKH